VPLSLGMKYIDFLLVLLLNDISQESLLGMDFDMSRSFFGHGKGEKAAFTHFVATR
jgi:hypothetical protein